MINNFDFQNKFGRVFYFYTGDLVYEEPKNGNLFSLPVDISEKELEDLQRKSLNDNVNYIEQLELKQLKLESDLVY